MQSKGKSFFESLSDVGIGFLGALAIRWCIICPIWGYSTSLSENLPIIAIFTFWAISRKYVVRRFFASNEGRPIKVTGDYLDLDIKFHQRGWRWKVTDGDDVICMGTNYHDNKKLAEDEAVKYFCRYWAVSQSATDEEVNGA